MPTSRAIAEYHDFLAYVLIHAPNEFPEEDYLPPDEQMTLDKAFFELTRDFEAVEPRVKDAKRMLVLREMLVMSHEAYRAGDDVRGAYILQEFEGLIWPEHRIPERFAAEAERRVAQAGASKE